MTISLEKQAMQLNVKDRATPCGACRQVLAEFGDLRVLVVDGRGRVEEFALNALLAHGFGASKLKRKREA